MRLVKVRECDGSCCRASPRFPNADHTDCIYHDKEGCQIMRGEAKLPIGMCPALPDMTAMEAYKWSCHDWPHNMPGRRTGDCCWQWVE